MIKKRKRGQIPALSVKIFLFEAISFFYTIWLDVNLRRTRGVRCEGVKLKEINISFLKELNFYHK